MSGGKPILDFFDARYVFATTRRPCAGAQPEITLPTDGGTYLVGRATDTVVPQPSLQYAIPCDDRTAYIVRLAS